MYLIDDTDSVSNELIQYNRDVF
uniref:Uncharacterized protein n=1 Tax=Lepeophtheirus salmonis TaxID=72036 RepID=A0A0K2V1U8_LEPSM